MLEFEKYVKLFVINTVLFFGLGTGVLASSVIINQVYYDPVATESGGEAVELYNPTPEDIILSSYVLKTESAAQDVILPQNAVIKAKHYFLITDAGWSLSKDNTSWDQADYEETMNMFNLDSGVALLDASGVFVDAVGWGDKVGITAGLYEGTPSQSVNPGFVLLRNNNLDTNNNSYDFVEAIPVLRNSSYVVTQEPEQPLPDVPEDAPSSPEENSSVDLSLNSSLEVVVSVENSKPSIEFVQFEDDNDHVAGSQITPLPAKNRSVAFHVMVKDFNGVEDVTNVTATILNLSQEVVMIQNKTLDANTALYSGGFDLPYYEKAGEYNVVITASDIASSSELKTNFEYMKLNAFALDTTTAKISSALLNTTTSLLGDSDISTTDKPTLINYGNTELQLGLLSTDLNSGNTVLSADHFGYSFGDVEKQGLLNTTLVTTNTYLSRDMRLPFNLFTTLPEYLQSGDYKATVTVYGISAE